MAIKSQKYRKWEVTKTCAKTTKVVDIFELIGSAAAAAGCGKVTMWRYMKDDKAYKGYHYRYPCKDTLPGEVWRVCRDAPRYEVSNLGRVRNRSTGKQLRAPPTSSGYH